MWPVQALTALGWRLTSRWVPIAGADSLYNCSLWSTGVVIGIVLTQGSTATRQLWSTYQVAASHATGIVVTYDDSTPHLVLEIQAAGHLKVEVEVECVAHDQGYSTYEEHGQYAGHSAFDMHVVRLGTSLGSHRVFSNRVADSRPQLHHCRFAANHPLCQLIRPGDKLQLWATALFPGWINTYWSAKVKLISFSDEVDETEVETEVDPFSSTGGSEGSQPGITASSITGFPLSTKSAGGAILAMGPRPGERPGLAQPAGGLSQPEVEQMCTATWHQVGSQC